MSLAEAPFALSTCMFEVDGVGADDLCEAATLEARLEVNFLA